MTVLWRVLPVGWKLGVPLSDDEWTRKRVELTATVDRPFRPRAFLVWQHSGNSGLVKGLVEGVACAHIETMVGAPVPADLFQCVWSLQNFGGCCAPTMSTTLLAVENVVTDHLDYLTLSRAHGLTFPTVRPGQQVTVRGSHLLGAAFIGETPEDE